MTDLQKLIKYCAIGFAILLTIGIIGSLINLAGLLVGVSFGGDVLEESKTYSVSGEVRSLVLEIGAADVSIQEGETLRVESNLEKLSVEEKGGVLTVRERKNVFFGATRQDAQLTLYLPADLTLEDAKIDTGAGRLTVGTLTADEVELELGAGEVVIRELNALQKADIDGGAGKVTVEGGKIHDLDLDLGVGKAELTAALSGKGEIDCGVGEMNLTLLGKPEDYSLQIKKGIGEIRVDGQTLQNGSTVGNGSEQVEISGGIGAVKVGFEEKE